MRVYLGGTWKYFSYDSDKLLACPCCGEQGMNDKFMRKIDVIRKHCSFPFIVTSGYRCSTHNQIVSTTGVNGPHTTGRAIDVSITDSWKRYILVQAAMDNGILRIGHGSNFMHLDNLTTADEFPAPNLWAY